MYHITVILHQAFLSFHTLCLHYSVALYCPLPRSRNFDAIHPVTITVKARSKCTIIVTGSVRYIDSIHCIMPEISKGLTAYISGRAWMPYVTSNNGLDVWILRLVLPFHNSLVCAHIKVLSKINNSGIWSGLQYAEQLQQEK